MDRKLLEIVIQVALFFACFFLLLLAFILAYAQTDSSCVAFYEVSTSVAGFLILCSVPMLLDLVYCILGALFIILENPMIVFYDDEVTHNIFSNSIIVIHNLVMAMMCIFGVLWLVIGLTYCGNSAQSYLEAAHFLAILAAILHVGNALLAFLWFTDNEIWFRSRD